MTVPYNDGDSDSFVPISNDMTVEDQNGDEMAFPEWRSWWHEVIAHGIFGTNSEAVVDFENSIAASLTPPQPLRSLRGHNPWDGKSPLGVTIENGPELLPVPKIEINTTLPSMRSITPLKPRR